MNYYKHHIGDYGAATAHLSWDEDMAYTRLLRAYYQHEKPLPVEARAVYRLVRAASKAQREAVDAVLGEFFTLEADGWHQKRCDEELDRAHAQAEANRKVAMQREERKRGAKSGSTNRSTNRDGNEHESFDTEKHDSFESREPSHKPLANSHEKAFGATHTTGQAPGVGSAAGHASAALNRAGCRVTSQNPDLIAACAEGVTTEHLLEVHRQFPDKPAGYAIATARREHAASAKPITGGTHAPAQRPGRLSAAERVEQNIRNRHRGNDDAIDGDFEPVPG